jgi:ATP-dependent Clp protease ATP-binding subunit ClpC
MRMNKYNFTPRVQKAISISKDTAKALNCSNVSLDHLIIAVISCKQSTITNFFENINISSEDFIKFIFDHLEPGLESFDIDEHSYSKHFKKVFALASSFAEELDHNYIGIEHIFYVLLVYEDSPLKFYLEKLGVDNEDCAEKLKLFFSTGEWESKQPPRREIIPRRSSQSTKSSLESFAKNYNELASSGKFDKVLCKDSEIEKISEILCRRNKNNPILIGLPGTGKTSLVEGLAQRIVNGSSTDFLSNKIIYEIDLAGMIAGTKYRGQFEQRLKKLIEEASSTDNTILFIDEIHTLVGAGSAEGSMDAANILKPALARGEIRCIGATTPKEYSKTILKDGALDRRFQDVKVEEPSELETVKILNGIINQYENFHHVSYRKSAIKSAVELSCKYINDRQLPDKAIDIIDQAGAKVKMKHYVKPNIARKIEQDLEKLMEKEDSNPLERPKIQKKQDKLIKRYQNVLEAWSSQYHKSKFYVTQKDIFDVISARTGIPINNLSKKESEIILNLKNELSKEIFHQEDAIDSLYNSIIRSKSGLNEGCRPIGSFLFLGKTGVGKTHTAKALARCFFGSEDNLISIDMSEYSEKINLSRLIGSSPGYVGYEDGGQLTDKIKNKPYSVLLFDEVEKAHPDVINVLLQVLEEGRLTDNFGRVSDFSNCIIIMTGNIGADLLDKGPSLGFSQSSDKVDDKIIDRAKNTLGVEFINRIDDVILFKDFSLGEIKELMAGELNVLFDRVLKKNNISITITEDGIDILSKKAFAEKMGARPIRKIIQKYIENIISKEIIKQTKKEIHFKSEDFS